VPPGGDAYMIQPGNVPDFGKLMDIDRTHLPVA
jgi:hypothetical protein